MTKKEFILKAMLQLAGSGQYEDKWDNCNMRRYPKEEQIFYDAEKLAEEAEKHLGCFD